MKYGLSTMLVVVFIVSVICGVTVRGSMVAFSIGFLAFGLLLIQMMARQGPRPVVVLETGDELKAHLMRNYLADCGVAARVEGSQGWQVYGILPARVVVPPDQADRARQLIDDFRPSRRNRESADANDVADHRA
jgi:hypothetical protein